MNGHDDLFDLIDYKDQNKQYDEEGNEIVEEDEDEPTKISNPMIEYSPQEELDRIGNRESYQAFRGY